MIEITIGGKINIGTNIIAATLTHILACNYYENTYLVCKYNLRGLYDHKRFENKTDAEKYFIENAFK